jgi:hypothetical protein
MVEFALITGYFREVLPVRNIGRNGVEHPVVLFHLFHPSLSRRAPGLANFPVSSLAGSTLGACLMIRRRVGV